MKKKLFLLLMPFFFVSCNDEVPVVEYEPIDTAILGMWQVDFSQTITGVRMRPNGTLEVIGEQTDTTTFDGTPLAPITSFMFGRYEENIIEIRRDNQIKIYRLNPRGGVTVSNEHVVYFVENDTLFRRLPNDLLVPHRYRLQNDTLIIERIPIEPAWTYTISRYFKTSF